MASTPRHPSILPLARPTGSIGILRLSIHESVCRRSSVVSHVMFTLFSRFAARTRLTALRFRHAGAASPEIRLALQRNERHTRIFHHFSSFFILFFALFPRRHQGKTDFPQRHEGQTQHFSLCSSFVILCFAYVSLPFWADFIFALGPLRMGAAAHARGRTGNLVQAMPKRRMKAFLSGRPRLSHLPCHLRRYDFASATDRVKTEPKYQHVENV